MQNKHETYPPRETSWEDSERIEKVPEAMEGLAAGPTIAPAGATLGFLAAAFWKLLPPPLFMHLDP